MRPGWPVGRSAGSLQRCLFAGGCTGAQLWQRVQQQWWLWPLAQTRWVGLAGAGGCPALGLGMQGRLAERAVARCSVGFGADLVGLTSIPLPVLHCGARAFFCCFFSLKPSFRVAKAVLKSLSPQNFGLRSVHRSVTAWSCLARRFFFGVGKYVRVYRVGTSLPCSCRSVRVRVVACVPLALASLDFT